MASERKIVAENVNRMLVKEYVLKVVERAGFGGLEIQRTPMGTRVVLMVEKPGLVIGKKGDAIKKLTIDIEKMFNLRNPQIEIQEVRNSGLNAQIMAQRLAEALERGWHFRRAGHSTVKRIMDAGARGCMVRLNGKLTGERHRTEKFKDGHIKFSGEPALQWVHKGFASANTKPGVIGVMVYITDPNTKLPDEVIIKMPGTDAVPAAPAAPIDASKAQEDAPKEGAEQKEPAAGEAKKDEAKEGDAAEAAKPKEGAEAKHPKKAPARKKKTAPAASADTTGADKPLDAKSEGTKAPDAGEDEDEVPSEPEPTGE